jgi:hypothetical protein
MLNGADMNEAEGIEGCRIWSCSGNSVFSHFHFADSAKREEQLDQIFGRIFGCFPHDVADCSVDRSVKQNLAYLDPFKIDAYWLPRLK